MRQLTKEDIEIVKRNASLIYKQTKKKPTAARYFAGIAVKMKIIKESERKKMINAFAPLAYWSNLFERELEPGEKSRIWQYKLKDGILKAEFLAKIKELEKSVLSQLSLF